MKNKVALPAAFTMCYALLWAACVIPHPVDTRVAFKGRLLIRVGADIIELTPDAASKKAAHSRVASGVGSARVSNDQRYLLYSTDERTLLHDLLTQETRVLFPHSSSGLMWSADGSRFAYLRQDAGCPELLFADLAGSTGSVYKAREAGYSETGGRLGGHRLPQRVCAGIGVGSWLGPGRFIFNRFEGEWPSELTTPGVPPNKTTLALIGDGVTLMDAPDLWSVHDVCAERQQVLLSKGFDEYVTEFFDDITRAGLRPVPRNKADSSPSVGDKVGFIHGDCRIFRIVSEAYGGMSGMKKDDMVISVISPDTLQEVTRLNLGRMSVWERPVFNAGGEQMAVVETDNDAKMSDPRRITIVDLNTKGRLTVYESPPGQPPHLLAWLR